MKHNQVRGVPIVSIVGVIASLLAGAALIFVVVTQSAGIHASHNAYVLSCKHTNALAHGLIDPSVERSRKSYEATIGSPFSTEAQITVAQANLAALEYEVKHFLNPVASNHLCVWPPVPIPKLLPVPLTVTPTT